MFCFLAGLIGNTLSIIVLSNRRMQSSTSCYLIALAVFDSIVLISLFLFMALPTVYLYTGELESYFRAYPYMHPYAYPTALIAQTCSIYITVSAFYTLIYWLPLTSHVIWGQNWRAQILVKITWDLNWSTQI